MTMPLHNYTCPATSPNHVEILTQHVEILTQHVEILSQHAEILSQHVEIISQQFKKKNFFSVALTLFHIYDIFQ